MADPVTQPGHCVTLRFTEVMENDRMNMQLTRRTFVAGLGAIGTTAVLPSFAAPARGKGIRFGYTAMTWGNEERQAIDDIAAVGFPGIQFRANAVADFKPAELKELLAQNKLTFVALSSGDISLDIPAADQIEKHVANAKFVKDSGGLYLQILDQLKTYPRSATPDECKRLGKLLTELGRRTADLGIPLGYHNHLNTLSQSPANLDLILENSDPKYVKLELDTAHFVAGGGDPAKAIEKYHDRLLFLHLKDVRDIPSDTPKAKYPFEFVELGQGRVDLPAVFAALHKVDYRGWAVVELDRVPDKSRTPKESADISKTYLEQKIGIKV
jgi:inosose dehydratase